MPRNNAEKTLTISYRMTAMPSRVPVQIFDVYSLQQSLPSTVRELVQDAMCAYYAAFFFSSFTVARLEELRVLVTKLPTRKSARSSVSLPTWLIDHMQRSNYVNYLKEWYEKHRPMGDELENLDVQEVCSLRKLLTCHDTIRIIDIAAYAYQSGQKDVPNDLAAHDGAASAADITDGGALDVDLLNFQNKNLRYIPFFFRGKLPGGAAHWTAVCAFHEGDHINIISYSSADSFPQSHMQALAELLTTGKVHV
jgi:hypothetical protein